MKKKSLSPRDKIPQIETEEILTESISIVESQPENIPVKSSNKLQIILLLILIFIAVIAFPAYYYLNKQEEDLKNNLRNKILPDAVSKIINKPSVKPVIENIKESNGLYQFDLTLTGSGSDKKYISYISKDGKILFTSGIKIDDLGKEVTRVQTKNPQKVTKTSKPKLELFVMSLCPYGLQIEKGLLPVLDILKNKIDFNLKFVSYTLHGEKEVDENLNQHCIGKIYPPKLNDYLKCFVNSGDADKCMQENGIDKSALGSCISQTDSKNKIKAQFNPSSSQNPFDVYKEDNIKYGVAGSPTVVLNGTVIEPSRSSSAILQAVCEGFSDKPAECGQKLPDTEPGPGFGLAQASANTAGAFCATQ